MADKKAVPRLAKHVAVLRIVFGLMWAINASFKWQSAFRNGFLDQIKSAADGQPSWLQGWFHFWIQLLSHNPSLFALFVTIVETLIAAALIFGFARRTAYLAAAFFSLMIWAIPEGFGGPYSATSTDIGTGIIYAIVFFSLYGLDRMAKPSAWTFDAYIVKRIPWWAVVANP
ncbi:MAG TPA: DoxX family membrane protein [Candidatus Saccharimonadales bacterium]|nr:DoxX family membrane protein [Candidatus Saccharimonadales bacterium]